MAQFQSTTLTDHGRMILAATQTGGTVRFPRMVFGDALLTDELGTLTEIPSVKQSLHVEGFSKSETEAKVNIWTTLTGIGLSDGYFLRSAGLYCDTPEGEVLYAVTTVTPDTSTSGLDYFMFIAPDGASMAVNLRFVLKVLVSQAAEITINAAPDTTGLMRSVNYVTPDVEGNVNISASDIDAAPTSHASPTPTHGISTHEKYGHTRITDTPSIELDETKGTAATPKAVQAVSDSVHKIDEYVHVVDNKVDIALARINNYYQSQDLTKVHADEIAAEPFYGNEWAWVHSRIRANDFRGIHIADYIPLMVNGWLFHMEVAGINGVNAYAARRQADFISRELYPVPVQWNRTNYNNGHSAVSVPFLASNVFAFLNSLQHTVPNGTTANVATTTVDFRTTGIYHRLPEELKSVIRPKLNIIPSRFSAGLLLTENNTALWANNAGFEHIGRQQFLWLPSEFEIFGATVFGGTTALSSGWDKSRQIQYPIFTRSFRHVEKPFPPGSPPHLTRWLWWTSTPVSGNSTQIVGVQSSGAIMIQNASQITPADGTGIHTPICFCIH